MASLTNTKIKNTYVSLLKVADNGQLDAALQDITDGAGNVTGVQLNTGGDLAASGTVSFGSLKDTGENITISKFVDAADGIGSNNNDTTIPTSAAVKLYVDTNITAQDLDFTTDSGTGAVDLDSQTFSILGTANEIETSGTGQTVTIGLPSSITVDVTGNLTGNVSGNVTGNVTGDLTGNVTATSVLANGVTATTQTIGDNSTKVATTAYVDSVVTAEDLDIAGDSGTGAVDLDSQTLTIAGTANEIETVASGQTITIGLPSTITANVNGNVAGDLTGTVLTAAQTNITSVGTLSSLAVSGNLTVDTDTLFVDAANNRVGIGTTSTNTNNFLQVSKSLNDGVVASVENINTGTAAYAELQVRNSATNNTGAARLMALGSAYTTAGGFVQDSAVLASDIDLGGGLSVMTRANADIRFYTNGHTNERMRIDSIGRVGIGTSAPGEKVVIEGATPFLLINNTDESKSGVRFADAQNTGERFQAVYDAGAAAFTLDRVESTGVITERMRIDSSGNVGIGTSTLSNVTDYVSLNLNDTVGSLIEMYKNGVHSGRILTDTNHGIGIYARTAESLILGTNDTERMRIDASGNVGIGTSSPNSNANRNTLTLQGAWGGQVDINVGATNHAQFGTDNFSSGLSCRIQSIDGIVFYGTGSTERMRIDASGNVGIGGIADSDYRIHLYKATNSEMAFESTGTSGGFFRIGTGHDVSGFGGAFRIYDVNAAAERMRITSGGLVNIGDAASSGVGRVNISANPSNNYQVEFFTSAGTSVGSITTSGGTTTNYNTSSDYRLKEDLQPISAPLDRVDLLNPVNFAWKTDGSRVDGFVAHELAEVIPEAVTGEKDAVDEEGNPIYQGIDQSKIVPLLVGAIKELKAEIETLKSQING
jgi:hypothetical protein